MPVQKEKKLNFFQNRLFRKKSARDTTTGTKNLKRGGRRKRAARPRKRHEPKLKSAELKFGNLAFDESENERGRYWKLLSDQEGNSIKTKNTQNSKQTNNMKQQRPGIKHKRKKEANLINTRTNSTHIY